MKYYKAINIIGWGDSYKLNVIYPGNYHHMGSTIEENATGTFKNDFELVTKAAYNKQEGIVPKPRVKKEVIKIGSKVEYLGGDSWAKDAKCDIGGIYTVCYMSDSSIKVKEDLRGYWLDKQYFKLSTQTKLKQTQMENYSIEGSKALKTAFVEECKLKTYTTASINETCIGSDEMPTGTVQGIGSRRERVHFVLPKDWDAAVKYVTEFNTPEPVFKVGDWVVVLPEDECYFNAEQGKAQQIKSIDSLRYNLSFSNGSINSYELLRKATPAEIKAATEPKFKMAGYDSVINKSAKTISFGCQTYTKKEVKLLLDAVELCARVGYSAKVKASGFVVNETDILTPANLTKILEQLK